MTIPRPCAALLETLGGDDSMLGELLDLFLDDAPQRVAAIRAALTAGDAPALARAAHAYKGSAGALAADEVVQCAKQLEMLAKSGTLAGAAPIVELLQSRSDALFDVIRTYRAAQPCAS